MHSQGGAGLAGSNRQARPRPVRFPGVRRRGDLSSGHAGVRPIRTARSRREPRPSRRSSPDETPGILTGRRRCLRERWAPGSIHHPVRGVPVESSGRPVEPCGGASGPAMMPGPTAQLRLRPCVNSRSTDNSSPLPASGASACHSTQDSGGSGSRIASSGASGRQPTCLHSGESPDCPVPVSSKGSAGFIKRVDRGRVWSIADKGHLPARRG